MLGLRHNREKLLMCRGKRSSRSSETQPGAVPSTAWPLHLSSPSTRVVRTPLSTPRVDGEGNPIEDVHALPTSRHILNYLLTQSELENALEQSYTLSKPIVAENRNTVDPVKEAKTIRLTMRSDMRKL